MKIVAITQARVGSSRLPGKVLKEISGKTLLQIHCERVLEAAKIDELVIATTNDAKDDKIVELSSRLNITCYRGSENDVLDRFYKAVVGNRPDYVVRVTSDCPLIDGLLIDEVIQFALDRDLDYCSNSLIESFPDGQDIEVIKFDALEEAWKQATLNYQREHVTPFIREESTYMGKTMFKSDNYPTEFQYGSVRLTVDEPKDFEVVKCIIEALGLDRRWYEYADFYLNNPKISELNSSIIRNEGFIKSKNNS